MRLKIQMEGGINVLPILKQGSKPRKLLKSLRVSWQPAEEFGVLEGIEVLAWIIDSLREGLVRCCLRPS